MGMFNNYDYIPGTYIPCNPCPPKIDFSKVHGPLEYYNLKDEFIGYTWTYGDSIVLEFNTCGEVIYEDSYEDASVYLSGKKMELSIYDFRGEVVYGFVLNAGTQVKFYIDENSSKRLVPGVYKFRLTLIDEENDTKYTLMPVDGDKCDLYIK